MKFLFGLAVILSIGIIIYGILEKNLVIIFNGVLYFLFAYFMLVKVYMDKRK